MNSAELQSVARIIGGGRHKLSGKQFVAAGYPAYGAGGLNGHLEYREFEQSAIVLSSIGARCGKCFFTETEWTSLANTQVIFPDLTKVDPKFLWYQLDNEARWPRSGAAQPFIRPSDVKTHLVTLPPLDEQRRIVAVLDKAFAGIATATANAQKNLTNARALFEGYLQSTFNKSGEGWIERRLGEICGLQNGFAFQSNTFQESGVPVLRISNIQNETIEARRLVYINPADYRENLDRFKVKKGALLIAMSGATTGKVGILDEDEIYYLNQRVGKFEPTAHLDTHYLFYYLITKAEENLSISAGSAQPNLSTAQIKEFLIPLPPIEQQAKVVEIFGEIREHCEQLKAIIGQKLAALTELKQSLLHEAFAGELT